MLPSCDVCVVGSGPIALFIAWSLEKSLQTYIPIYSDRLFLSGTNTYTIITDHQTTKFRPRLLPFRDLINTPMCLIVVCSLPKESFSISRKLRQSHATTRILLLCSYAVELSQEAYTSDELLIHAWPLISVEQYSQVLVATNPIDLEITQKNHTFDLETVSVLSHFFPSSQLTIVEPKRFLARTFLTYSIYSFMLRCRDVQDLFDRSLLEGHCKHINSHHFSGSLLKVSDFPGFVDELPFDKQLFDLSLSLFMALSLSPTATFNVLHLFSNKSKLLRFIENSCFSSSGA